MIFFVMKKRRINEPNFKKCYKKVLEEKSTCNKNFNNIFVIGVLRKRNETDGFY